MASKKKEVRVVAPSAAVTPRLEVVALYVPEKTKQTAMLNGSPAEAAAALVKKLREEARVLA
jgi:electron transfer flavoprotein beta subunit